ncbi:MAG TPA: tripartite tricarboxylate transporter substrate binding protein [Burkholderiales bacterium]|nr:tripartite tricarboxylate transporter substrate binding protein [Burkholderiales bacterium]
MDIALRTRRAWSRCALGVFLACAAAGICAQEARWPVRPVRFIVPFPPGGSVDPLARLVGAKLAAATGQNVVVDNRPGGSGSIGAGIAAKSPPDGYTYLFVFDTHAVNPTLIPNLPFDTVRDFAPVMLVGTAPMALVTHPAKPYRSFGDAVRAAKAKPDAVTYGSIGSGSLGHLTMKLLEQAGGFRMVHVPYKGGGPMIVDASAGHVELGIASVAVLATHVRGGRLRAIAVTGDKRTHAMPEVPALAEQGFPGFSALAWWGIFAPAGVPQPVIARFHAELTRIFGLPEVRAQLADTLGMDLVVSSPAALQKFLVAEIERWGKVVRETGIKPD